jgi:hypothetical protein
MRTRLSLLACLCLALGLGMASSAGADYDPLASGQTRLVLDRGFLALLGQNGVKLSATAPAKLRGSTVSFPVSGGKFDPTAARGTVEHEGTLILRAGPRNVPIRALQLKTTSKHAPFSAKVGGSQLKLATAKGLEVTRQGFGDKVTTSELTLSSKLATRLAKKLRLRGAFKAGQPLGKSLTAANPATIALLAQNKVELSFAPTFAAKLGSLFVALNPIFGAEHPSGPTFTLPIAGGTLAPDASQGTVQSEGSLEFIQLGGGQVFWGEGWLDLAAHTISPELNTQPSPPYAGKAGRLSIASLTLGAPAAADPRARTVAVSGATAAMDPATAATFNEVFAAPQGKSGVFVAGEAVGTVSFTAQGQ